MREMGLEKRIQLLGGEMATWQRPEDQRRFYGVRCGWCSRMIRLDGRRIKNFKVHSQRCRVQYNNGAGLGPPRATAKRQLLPSSSSCKPRSSSGDLQLLSSMVPHQQQSCNGQKNATPTTDAGLMNFLIFGANTSPPTVNGVVSSAVDTSQISTRQSAGMPSASVFGDGKSRPPTDYGAVSSVVNNSENSPRLPIAPSAAVFSVGTLSPTGKSVVGSAVGSFGSSPRQLVVPSAAVLCADTFSPRTGNGDLVGMMECSPTNLPQRHSASLSSIDYASPPTDNGVASSMVDKSVSPRRPIVIRSPAVIPSARVFSAGTSPPTGNELVSGLDCSVKNSPQLGNTVSLGSIVHTTAIAAPATSVTVCVGDPLTPSPGLPFAARCPDSGSIVDNIVFSHMNRLEPAIAAYMASAGTYK